VLIDDAEGIFPWMMAVSRNAIPPVTILAAQNGAIVVLELIIATVQLAETTEVPLKKQVQFQYSSIASIEHISNYLFQRTL
jgi:hypothetical protein